MSRLTMNFDKRLSTRLKAVLAVLGCLGLLLGAVAPRKASAQGSRYVLTVRNQSRYQIDRLYLSTSD